MGLLGTLGSLNILFSADTAQFHSAMEKVAYTTDRTLRKLGLTTSAFKNIGLAAATALATGAVAGARFADEMSDMSGRVGISVRKMSELAYAAKMSDVQIASLESALKKMAINVYDNSVAFDNLGVTLKDKVTGNYRSLSDIFDDVIDRFSMLPDTVGKAKVSVEVFGKTGADIRPLLDQGVRGLQDFAKEAKNLGVVIDEETVKNAERFDSFVKRATEAAKGFGVKTFDFIYTAFKAVSEGAKIVYTPLEKYEEQLDRFRESSALAYRASQDQAKSAADAARAYELAAKAAEEKRQMEEDGKKLTESLRTAQEKYNDEIAFYNTLLEGGAITQETFARASKKALDALNESTSQSKKLADAANDFGWAFQSAFEDAIIEGKKFHDMLIGLANDIQRIIIRKAITEPIGNAISAGISNVFSPKTTTPSSRGNVFSFGDIVPFANGGVIAGPVSWPMSGGRRGLAGEAGQEVIAPLFRTSSGDMGVKSVAPRVEVNVYAPEGSKVKQERKFDGDREQINIMIDEAVAGNIGRAGSKTHRSLRNTFGVSQALTAR